MKKCLVLLIPLCCGCGADTTPNTPARAAAEMTQEEKVDIVRHDILPPSQLGVGGPGAPSSNP